MRLSSHSQWKWILLTIAFGLCSSQNMVPAASTNQIPVEVYLTTTWQSALMAPQPPLTMQTGQGQQGVQITVNDGALLQEIDGWGGSMTESSAYLFWLLKQNNAAVYWQTLKRLFTTTAYSGDSMSVNFGILRIPAGTCDFALGEYTYDDTWNDWSLNAFNTNEDQKYIIPVVQDIFSINPHMKVIMTPWSPPAWMKTSNSLFGGYLSESAYDVYSTYFVKFLQAYQGYGIPVYAVAVQNEPLYQPSSYAGMAMSPQNQIAFVKLLGPKLSAAGLNTKVIVYDHNWDGYWFPMQVLQDPTANSIVSGSSFHCYGGVPEDQWNVYNAYPQKEIYMTECNGLSTWNYGFGASITDNIKWYLRSIRSWARTILMWNYALDFGNGPQNGGCNVCGGLVTIDPSTLPNVYFSNGFYYGMGHFSKFLTPGSHAVTTTLSDTSCMDAMAFKNTDGTIHIGVVNSCGTQTLQVQWNGYSVVYQIPNGAATLKWNIPAVTTAAVTTAAETTGTVSTAAATTAAVSTGTVTTAAVSTGTVTTAAVSTVAVSTGTVSTAAVSTGTVSTAAVSTGTVTIATVSTAAVSTGTVSTAAVSTGTVTIAAVSTGTVTTAYATTAAVTTGNSAAQADQTQVQVDPNSNSGVLSSFSKFLFCVCAVVVVFCRV